MADEEPKQEEVPQEEAQEVEQGGEPYAAEKTRELAEGAVEVVNGTPKTLAGLIIGSLMVLIKAAKSCDDGADCEDYLGWAVACSAISLAIGIAALFLLRCIPDFENNIAWFVIVIFTACLWVAGAGTMTFKKPYKNTLDNGYFGAWIALLSALGLLSSTFSTVFAEAKAKVSKTTEIMDWWFILFAGSTVAMIQSAIDCDEARDCEDELAWALAASTISVVVCLVLIIVSCCIEDTTDVWKWGSLFLLIWWMCGTGVSTYKKGPYKSAGNGYFSMWIALMAAGKIFGLAFFTGSGSADEEVADKAVNLGGAAKGNSYIIGLMLFSLAVLIAAAIECDEMDKCEDYRGWAVACPAISICICIFLLIAMALELFGEDIMNLVKTICTCFLLCIWIAGTYCMTFRRPFASPANANGWFGAWLALIAVWTMFMELPFAPNLDKYGGWAYKMMAVGSLILGVQAAHDCSDFDCEENYYAWAVACGFAGFFVYLVFVILCVCDCMTGVVPKVFAIFFAGWYSCGMAILTYERPYSSLANGYLGTWVATICSYLILVETLLHKDAEVTEEVVEEEKPEEA